MQSEVNIKYVLGLEEKHDKTLQKVQIGIPQSSDIIDGLEVMIEDCNNNLYDMSSYFYSHIKPIKDCYNYCFPEEYFYSFLNEKVTPKPQYLPYGEYKEIVDSRRKSWDRWSTRRKDMSKEDVEKQWKEYVHKIEHSEKKRFFSLAKKYVLCQNLYKAMQEAHNNSDIRIYSRDTVGRKHFFYDINDDVKVDVYTNFGYGKSSHFFLTIKYKDIVLLPYSDLVHFYYAQMKSLVNHTKAYRCYRDSWTGLMDYLEKFVNNSRLDPDNFVRNYVLNEIEEMMMGLRDIMKNPSEILEHMKAKNGENIRLSVVRPFDKQEFIIYEAMPEELTTIFKIEKISGSLHFMENLKSMREICSEIDAVINEIIDLNKLVAPEVPAVLESINSSITPLQEEYDAFDKDLNKKNGELERLEKKLYHKLSYCRSSEAREKCTESFKKLHPRYETVAKEINEVTEVMETLNQRIERRKSLRRRLIDCSIKMDEYLKNDLTSDDLKDQH